MSEIASLTEPEKRELSSKLKGLFAARREGGRDVGYSGPDYTDESFDADFRRAIETQCPAFTIDEILGAAFDAFANPVPADLWGPVALARTQTYAAGRRRDAADWVQSEVDWVNALIGRDVNWMARAGVIFSVEGSHPPLAYVFASEVNLAAVDGEAFDRIERAAVLFNKLRPDYLPCLATHLDDFRFVTYDGLVADLQEATERLATEDAELEDG